MAIGLYVCGLVIAAIFCVGAITAVTCIMREEEEDA